MADLPTLAAWLSPAFHSNVRFRFGKISATPGGNVVSVTVGGGSTVITNVRYNAAYTPTVNDVVVIAELEGGSLFVLCELA